MEQNIHWTSLYLPSNARCISEFELLNEKLQVQLKADLKRDIYTQNKIKEKEISVVEYLARFRPLKEDVLTPESDVYVTPESSPTDAHYTFGPARCASDSSLVKASPSDNKYLHTTNPLYYSLVTVDEVYPCESADILEKELAEQDQLFKSFKSIISRDSKVSKTENKSGLKVSQSHNTLRSGSPKQRSVNKSLELKLVAKLSKKDNYSFKNSNSTIKNQWLKNVVSTNYPISSANSPTHSKDNGDVCNCRRIKGFCDGSKPCEITIMSKPKLEIDEVLDAESNGGPDSCLEAGSSGYLTGSSPRDHTVSEPYGGDLTEVATSDDIPHDNDQSARSSSMSSDAGTWDSTFPAVSEGTVKEQITGEKTKRPVELGDHDCNLTISNEHKPTGEGITVCYSTCPVQSISVVNIINKSYLPSADNPLIFNDGGSRNHCEHKSSTFESYKPEKSASNSAISDREMAFKNKEDKLCSSKNNFFIDAASLLDENEMSSIPPNSLSCNGYESQDGSSWSGSDVGNCVPRVSDQSRLLTDIKTNVMQSPEQNDIELRRGSLIRRNTFELELDDERLEKLRVKCEKHKEKSPHYLSNSFSANNGGSKEFSLADNCRQKPNTLPGQLDPFTQTQKADDEVHSPDSLNNDGPLYEPLEKHHKPENCYPLPFEMNSYASLKDYNDHKVNAYSSEEQPLTNYLGGDSTILSDIGSDNTSGHFNSFNREILNNIESTPILSGGICSQDVPPEKVFSSPLMNRRKTEFAPIISGGAVVEPEPEPLPKPRSNSSFSASWVVDMSEQSRTSEIESVSMKETSMDSNVSDDIQRPSKSNHSSLGYFISLDSPTDDKVDTQRRKSGPQTNNKEIDSVKTVESNKIEALTSNANQSSCSSSSCGFYVDLKDNLVSTETSKEKESAPDKKLFSMFIDIGDSKTIDGSKSNTCSPHVFKKRNHTRTFSGVFPKTSSRLNESQKSSQSSLDTTESSENLRETPKGRESAPIPQINSFANTPNSSTKVEEKPPKQGFFMFIENDNSPVPQRRTLPSGQLPSSQRHSWNSDSHNFNLPIIVNNGNSSNIAVKNNHRRSHSVSVNKSLEVMFNVEQNENKSSSASPLVKGSTSNSIGYESGPSSIDESGSASKSCNKRMMASWHGSIKPSAELQKVIAKGDLKERESRTIYKKHSLDATSEIADEICDSIDKSDEICQSQTESKGDDTFDISNTSHESSNIHNSTFIISDISNVANATSNDLELTTPTCDIVSQLSKDDSDKTETDFDDGRDKKYGEIPRTPDHSMSHVEIPPLEPKFSFVKLSDMDKEPKKLVVEEKNVPNRMSRSIPEASWIETKMMTRSATSRSLSRLFPHLNASNRNPTPDSGERESDYSELSSMQSSMDPSALEGSTEDTDASAGAGGPVSRLGEDLLRMFLDEISPDVTVEVGGRRIKAHKCILSSRCQYFAAILSGGWVESAGNVISLQGFSFSAVHFALCHIYSGVSNIPDSINIVELATLADMLCLEGLKEVIMYTLKVKYCHFFHKPCPMCTVGVLECLPLAAAYGLDEIYRKSLRWITKHFVRVWPTKGFATLPKELLDKCYKQHVVHMTVDNVLETVLSCHKLQGLIPNVRWAESVFTLATKLYEATVKFIAQHYCEILSCDTFMSLGRDQAWSASQLEETLVSAAERLPPDQACRSHSHLHKLSQAMLAPDSPLKPSDGFCEFVRLLSTSVEGCLLRQAARASRTPAWALMEPQLRHRIQDAACLVIVPGDDRRRARHLAKKAEALGSGKRPVELLPAKNTVSDVLAHKRHNSAVRTSAPPAVKPKTPQPVNKAENTGSRPKTWPYKIIEVKSRYLEPKATPKPSPAPTKPERTTQGRRATSKSIISSSDSSRTSSPAMRRAGAPRVSRSLPSKRDDALTMSTDSLTDPATSSQKKRADTITKSQSTASRIDFVERNIKSLSLKSVRASSGEKAKPKAEEKPKFSPVAINKKTSTQSSPHVRDSPSAVKSTVNSTPSPLLRRNTLSPKEKCQLAETKSAPLKRTSTYRVAPKAARPRETGDASPNNKGNINKIQKVTASKKSVANNNFISDNRKTDDKPQPMVGSRSGTFLKDEPTVLKKPQVVDVSE